jgi:hypothetical protein
MSHMFNVGIQRELPWRTVLDVAYVGTRGKNIFVSRNINVPLPGPGNLNQRRPFFSLVPNITQINQRSGDAESWYDALQLKVDKRFAHGLQALLSYTFSRTEDTAFILHPAFETRAKATGKAVDIPHNLVVSWTYELPFGEGRRFAAGASGVVQKLVAGWSVNGITSYQSGEPLNIRLTTSQLNTGTDNWPNQTCSEVPILGQVTQWFDTSCFTAPPLYEFGNYEIGAVRGPTFFNTDFGIFKRTGIGGNRLVELRVEVFNLFNHAHFSNPNDRVGNASFGRISSTRFPSRQIQLGGRFLF